jgi:putative transposase
MGYSVTTVLKILKISRSSYYYAISHKETEKKENGGRPVPGYSIGENGKKICDEQIKEWISELIDGDGFAYGYYKLTIMLRRQYKLCINKKKVYRLCKEMGILKSQRKIKPKHPKKLARNREITKPNQLWEVDVKYGYIAGEDRFFYILSYIDVLDRSIVDYYIGLRCEAKDAIQTLQRALLKRNLYMADNKPIIRSDNGPQFTSNLFEERCIKLGVEHERIPSRTPNKNAHIEAFHKILEEECLGIDEFETYGQAYGAVVDFMERYNKRRIHSSIGYLTPEEYYKAAQAGTGKKLVVKL